MIAKLKDVFERHSCNLSTLTLCPLRNFSCFFVLCGFFQNQLFHTKNLSGVPSESQTDWHFVRPDLGPNCLQNYQQITLGDKELALYLLVAALGLILTKLFYTLIVYSLRFYLK